jgi:hypothetical protein
VRTFAKRHCDRCWREFVAVAEHQRFCSARCRWLSRSRDETRLYANPIHRGTRQQHVGTFAPPRKSEAGE